MYHLLPYRGILRIFLYLNTLILAVVMIYLYSSNIPINRFLGIASITLIIIDFTLLLLSIVWRRIWSIKFVSDMYFPDINGIWEGKIIFDENYQEKSIDARARIRQSLESFHIDLYSTTSQSSTLVAYLSKESNNILIYYVYLNEPNKPEYPPFYGSARLKLSGNKNKYVLSGAYFTDQKRKGVISLGSFCQSGLR